MDVNDLLLPISRKSREESLLATFLFLNCSESEADIKKYRFKLDVSIFSTELKRRIAKKMNECDYYEYSFTGSEIIDSLIGTKYELELIDIIGQNYHSLITAKKYHDDLVKKTRMERLV